MQRIFKPITHHVAHKKIRKHFCISKKKKKKTFALEEREREWLGLAVPVKPAAYIGEQASKKSITVWPSQPFFVEKYIMHSIY